MLDSFEQIPDQLQKILDSELSKGEQITWLAKPLPGRLARKALPVVLFGIPWTAFAIFWTAGAASATSRGGCGGSGLFSAFPLFGLPFILIGLGMLSNPLWMYRSAKRTAYILTNRRAIVLASNWRGCISVRSFEPEKLKDLTRKENADGSGDLVFANDFRYNSNGHGRSTDVGFLAISEVQAVEKKVRALIDQNREGEA